MTINPINKIAASRSVVKISDFRGQRSRIEAPKGVGCGEGMSPPD